jgi:Mg2+ and Co2+ transporter CorA
MPVTVDEQQAEYIREVNRSLTQIENVLLHRRAQDSSMLREIQRLKGTPIADLVEDYE